VRLLVTVDIGIGVDSCLFTE